MSELRRSTCNSKWNPLVCKVAPAFCKEHDVGLRIRVNCYSIESSSKVKDMHISAPQKSQLLRLDVSLRNWGNLSDPVNATKVLTHVPFDWCILSGFGVQVCGWLRLWS